MSSLEEKLDAADYEPVKEFFTGEQKAIYEKALRLMEIYDESKTFIVNDQVEEYVAAVKAILHQEAPYRDIPKLPELLDNFSDAYASVLENMFTPVKTAIDNAKARVFEVLNTKAYKAEFYDRYIGLFYEIYHKASHCNNVATLHNIKLEADVLKVRLLNEMSKKDAWLAAQKVKEEQDGGQSIDPPPKPKVKKKKNISIKSISVASSWQIETAADVEKYMVDLKERILKELDEDTIVNIEF